jgi:chromosome transmission fidelity protein 4
LSSRVKPPPGEEVDAMENGEENGTTVEDEREKLEETFVRGSLDAALLVDLVEATSSTHTQRSELARKEVEIDKALLQLLAVECREGEERGMKALELVELMRDGSGRMIEAAVKIAERYGRTVLGEKIREVGERRMAGEMEGL